MIFSLENNHHRTFSLASLVFIGMAALIQWGCSSTQTMVVEMAGDDYHWHVRYPGADGTLHTHDDVLAQRDLYVPANTQVIVRVTSEDYIYALKVPQLGLNQMGVPDVVFEMAFSSGQPRRYEFLGDQMCGFSHDTLNGSLVVLPQSEFEDWLKQMQTAPNHPSRPEG